MKVTERQLSQKPLEAKDLKDKMHILNIFQKYRIYCKKFK